MGLFEFIGMPLGLTTAPATLQRLANKITTPDLKPNAFAYLDDIIIITQTFEDHLRIVEIVLARPRDANLEINLEKSIFCSERVRYLGYVVDVDVLQVDPTKMEPVLNYPSPTAVSQVRRFLGMACWYRGFISNFSAKAEPITRLLCNSIEMESRKTRLMTYGTNALVPRFQRAIYDSN